MLFPSEKVKLKLVGKDGKELAVLLNNAAGQRGIQRGGTESEQAAESWF